MYILLQGWFLYVGLFIIIYNIPASALPDKYEDSFGNTYEFPPERKEDMKQFALYAIAVVGFFTIWFQCYLYYVVKRWASKETLIEHAKEKRLSSARAGSRGASQRPSTNRSTRSA